MIITQHAINKFRQRTGCVCDDNEVKKRILKLYEKAEEVELKPEYRVIAILNHKCEPAKYLRFAQFIFVCIDNVLKTIHLGEAKRWIPKCK